MKQNITFDPQLKNGDYLADYFIKTKTILEAFKPNQNVTMQWFQRNNNVVVCGLDYVVQLIKFVCPNWKDLKIQSLRDGDIVNQMEPVLKITGKYRDFAFLEGMIDGILARATSVATNSRRLIDVANGKTVLNMNDRADLYVNQQLDGYASYIGGIKSFVTKAAIEYIDDQAVLAPQGTMPHALIASFNGDLVQATEAFYQTFPNNNLVALIDYNNDCVNDAIKVAQYFRDKLKMVRIDTSFAVIDKSLQNKPPRDELRGVNPTLIKKVRQALDENGGQHVKIIVSSGFDVKKIAWFEAEKTPVDIYGVGEAITKERINFTGDIVLIDGKPQAKIGRKNIESGRLNDII
jgi:nicotinate phosphoribosyltransferase